MDMLRRHGLLNHERKSKIETLLIERGKRELVARMDRLALEADETTKPELAKSALSIANILMTLETTTSMDALKLKMVAERLEREYDLAKKPMTGPLPSVVGGAMILALSMVGGV